jgi:NitT/TauT family transport system substrate-binding protein
MKKNYLVAIVILIVIVGISLGGLYASGYFNQPKLTEKITVGILNGDLHHLALQVAIKNGYFEQYNLTVVTRAYDNGPNLMLDFVSGALDFAYVGVPPAMTARANAMASGNVTNLPIAISSVNLEGSAIVVNPSRITTISDLNGKTIGTPGAGTIQDILLTIFAQQNNLTIIKYEAQGVSNLPVFFQQGIIDGLIAWEPTPALAINNYNASLLLTSHDLFPDHQCCVLVVNQNLYNMHPDIVQKMVAIHEVATSFIGSNSTEAAQIAVNFTGLPLPVVQTAFGTVIYDTTINIESCKTFLSALINLGRIPSLNLSQVDSFIDAFIKQQ